MKNKTVDPGQGKEQKGETPAGYAGSEGRMQAFEGLGVSTGVVTGPAVVLQGAHWGELPSYTIAAEDVDAELGRLQGGINLALQHLSKIRATVGQQADTAAEELELLLDVHTRMLQRSRLVREAETLISTRYMNAESAVREAAAGVADALRAAGDSYLAGRAEDIWEVGRRILRGLGQGENESFDDLPEGAILFAEDITPADVAQMDPARIGGFVATLGGAEGHAAIIARALGIPAVLGVAHSGASVATGDLAVLDGRRGDVVINPDRIALADFRYRMEQEEKRKKALSGLLDLSCETRDGEPVSLRANMELPIELDAVLHSGAEGVGLLRTEFLFMNRPDLPDEEEQYNMLVTIIRQLDGRPLTARTLDIGGEKPAPALEQWLGHAPNPALGLRAVRLSLRVPDLLRTQLRAMLRAAAHASPRAPMRILLPMVVTRDEVIAVRKAMGDVATELREEGYALPPLPPPLGVMIEVPGAALAADSLAREADFFALGTNDLTMYTLAIDRGDERTATLYNPLHPAVLRLIRFTVEAAARARIPVSVCGEIAGDPLFTPLLVGMGVRELSMSAYSLPRVKRRIREMSLSEAAEKATQALDLYDPALIREVLES